VVAAEAGAAPAEAAVVLQYVQQQLVRAQPGIQASQNRVDLSGRHANCQMHSQHATCIARSMMLEGTTSAAVGVSPQHQGFFSVPHVALCWLWALISALDLALAFGSARPPT
jgi:hypothetical protein